MLIKLRKYVAYALNIPCCKKFVFAVITYFPSVKIAHHDIVIVFITIYHSFTDPIMINKIML